MAIGTFSESVANGYIKPKQTEKWTEHTYHIAYASEWVWLAMSPHGTLHALNALGAR